MPYPRPTLEELRTRGRADLEDKLDGAQARLFGTPEQVLADVSSGHGHSLHGHLDQATRQLFPHLMDDEWVDEAMKTWKVLNGAGGFGRIPATRASGKITITKNLDSSDPIPDGTRFTIGDLVYTLDIGEGFTFGLITGPQEKDVTAENAGNEYNADAGAVAKLETPILGVNTNAIVTAGGLAGGSDVETLEAARVRLLEKIRSPGAGGARGDYSPLAKAVNSNVTRAFEQPRILGPGTMRVVIYNDNETDHIADGALVLQVQDALQKLDTDGFVTGTAPTSAIVTITAGATKELQVTAIIELNDGASFDNGDGTGVKFDVEVELAALVANISKPLVTITPEEVGGAIQRAAGVKSHTLTLPAGDITHTALQIPIVGAHTLTEV